MEKINFYYVTHTDNLEGKRQDFLYCVQLETATAQEHINNINNNSDGETSHTPLYLSDIKTGEIVKNFTGVR